MFWEREIQLGEIAAGPKMGIPLKKNKGRCFIEKVRIGVRNW